MNYTSFLKVTILHNIRSVEKCGKDVKSFVTMFFFHLPKLQPVLELVI